MKKLIVNPVPKQSVQKRHLHRMTYLNSDGSVIEGQSLNKNKVTKRGRSATDKLIFAVENGKIKAGLEE